MIGSFQGAEASRGTSALLAALAVPFTETEAQQSTRNRRSKLAARVAGFSATGHSPYIHVSLRAGHG